MDSNAFNFLQKIGKSFVLPIAALPLAGLLLGVGSTLTNPVRSTLLQQDSLIFRLVAIVTDSGNILFGILPLLFAVGVALGLAKKSKEVATLSALIAYFVMNAALASAVKNFLDADALRATPGLITSFMGFRDTMNTSVLGGVIIGIVVAALHNRYYKIILPDMLAFFSGTRFIPVISTVVAIIIGIALAFIWPLVARGIACTGTAIAGMGAFGVFLYGVILRALIPTGLHHVFYMPFWQTALGGTATVGGEIVAGAQNILFAQLAHGDVISPAVARFYSGNYIIMMFGFPAAALAMYHCACKNNKVKVKGLLFSAAITSFLTGITEPLEFSFLFASPLLYFGIHCLLSGAAFAVVYLLDAGVGYTFSGGVFDFLIYGVIPGNERTHWIAIVITGVAFALIYYAAFRIVIMRLNLKTPGREEDPEAVRLYTRTDCENSKQPNPAAPVNKGRLTGDVLNQRIIAGLGGVENIKELDNCATRLRVTLAAGEKINRALLKETGAAGVFVKGNSAQVVYGLNVERIKTELAEYLSAIQKG